MSWIGGKKALRELIVRLFPLYYERYIEVFGGGGWVLFHKPPGNDFEVYNDFNGLLVNLYRCVRDKPEELMEAMESYAQVESLQQTIYQGEGNTILLIDKLEEKVNQSEQVLNRLFLEEILGKLEGEERELIYQRYFQEKTQSVIAKEMGISQVQVSRMEKRILRKIQEEV